MTVSPPFLLIDVDGVLNPFPGPGGSVPPGYRPCRLSPDGHADVPVRLDPDHGSWIPAISSGGLVRPVWATSWAGEADRLIAPRLNLPRLPPHRVGDTGRPHRTSTRLPVETRSGERVAQRRAGCVDR